MQFIGSVVFTVFLFLWTFFYAIFFVIACLFLPFRLRFVLARVWGAVLLKALQWTCRLDYRVEGLENLPPGSHVALWKHSSSWETIAMAVIFPRQVWVLKRELTWIPFVGWGIVQLHAIAIDRKSGGSAVSQVIEQGSARLAEGSWVIIFPEGTRMARGQTRKYGGSGALLAKAAGRMIVPVAHNSGDYWPRRGLMKKAGTIRVAIGPAIPAANREAREINDDAQAWIEGKIRSWQALPRSHC
jgi:1-acyl-sn-glycerol-3-phosphate acyltransferase